MVTELLQRNAGIKLTHIPYKGASQALTDMLGGHLPAAAMTLTTAAAQLDAKRVRALAVSSPKRVADYPDIPTYAEQGFPDIIAHTWFGLSGPSNMPSAIVRKLNAEVIKALRQPDVQERLRREAIYTEPFTPEEFTAFFQARDRPLEPARQGVEHAGGDAVAQPTGRPASRTGRRSGSRCATRCGSAAAGGRSSTAEGCSARESHRAP